MPRVQSKGKKASAALQNSILTSLTPSSVTNLTSRLPPFPSGYEVETVWQSSVSLNPLAVYVVAIRLMYGFSLQPWSQRVELVDSGLNVVVQTPSYNVIIYTSDSRASTDLTTGFCVRALYMAIMCMAEREPGFYDSTNYIVKQGEPIGRILITTVDPYPTSANYTINAPNATLSLSDHALNKPKPRTTRTTSSPTSTPTASSGTIVDPDDPLFKIRFEFHGQKLPTGDVLNAAFDGLAMISLYGRAEAVDDITALSLSRKVVWHMGRSSDERLLGGEISQAFNLLVRDLFLKQRRFQELWYYFDYDGENLGDGYVIKWTGQEPTAIE